MEFTPTPISDEDRAELAIRREAFDLRIEGIRARNGESYADRLKAVGHATTEAAASPEDLEKSN